MHPPEEYARLRVSDWGVAITQARRINRSQRTSVEHRSIDSRERTVRLREQSGVGRAHR